MLTAGICQAFAATSETLAQRPGVTTCATGTSQEGRVTARLFTVSAQDFLAEREMQEEIFGPPPERRHLLPGEALRKPLGEREAQIGPALLDGEKARPDHRGFEAAPHGFDFGEFGHSARSSSRASGARPGIGW